MPLSAQDSVRYLLDVIASYRGLIFACAVILTGGIAIIVANSEPVWRASATVLVPGGQLPLSAIEGGETTSSAQKIYLATQVEILRSRQMAETVIAKLGLLQQAEYASATDNERRSENVLAIADPLQMAVDSYVKRLFVEPVDRAQTIKISVESGDRELAAIVANAHAEAYLTYTSRQSGAVDLATDFALTWMSERLELLRQELNSAEDRLQLARRRAGRNLESSAADDSGALLQRLEDARRKLASAKAIYREVYQGRAEPREDLKHIPAIDMDASILEAEQKHIAADAHLADMVEQFGRDDLRTLQAEWNQIAARELMNGKRLRVAEQIRADYESAREEEAAAARAMQNYEFADEAQSGLKELQNEVDIQRTLYSLFYELTNETLQTIEADASAAQIISEAVLPDAPVAPRSTLIFSLALLLSLLLGTTIALLLAARKRVNTLHGVTDAIANLDVPILGALPPLAAASSGDNDAIPLLRAKSEAIAMITAGINHDYPGKVPQIIYVTSSADGEGKSTTALNLATAFARQERVLLIDADVRGSALTRDLAVPINCRGLTELIAGDARLNDVIVRHQHKDIDTIGAGRVPANPSALLSSGRVDSMFKVLSMRYDRIVVDGPPVGEFDDSLLLARHANSVVYVANCDDTRTVQIQNSLERLRHGGIRITGMVLNHMDRRNGPGKSAVNTDAAGSPAPVAIQDGEKISQVIH